MNAGGSQFKAKFLTHISGFFVVWSVEFAERENESAEYFLIAGRASS
jgi:hypothetical protein